MKRNDFEYTPGNEWAYCDADDDERTLARLRQKPTGTRVAHVNEYGGNIIECPTCGFMAHTHHITGRTDCCHAEP